MFLHIYNLFSNDYYYFFFFALFYILKKKKSTLIDNPLYPKCMLFSELRIYKWILLALQLIRYTSIFAAINQVMLLGRVGADPEKRGTEQHPVVTFSMATHTNYRKGEGNICLFLEDVL